jgi:two-component system, sensor histidine kinase and response regulator
MAMKDKSINVGILQELVGDDQSVINDILQEFRLRSAETAADLDAACGAQHCGQASEIAHKLKSSARSIGALKLGGWCEQIEHAGRNGEADKLKELILGFKLEMAAVESYLTSWPGVK